MESARATQLEDAGRRRRRDPRRRRTALVGICLAGLLVLATAPAAEAGTPALKISPDVGVLPFAPDVQTIGSNGSLIPVDPSSTPLSAPLFNLGGQPLGLTWGQFSSATAQSVARTDAHHGIAHTDFLIGMSGLVPNGVYSLFYRTFGPDSDNAVCPDVEPLVALTSAFGDLQQPDADSFIATSSGTALFLGRVAGELLAAQQLQVVVIYHFDGNTYGPVPTRSEATFNCVPSYGIDAMRQMLIVQK